ncbi:glycosyltransferase family 9 protein [Flexithrix dorotheae]|uniref:glycosyltransferase family 9 protein n=1 Tax=Flexithrix dorotheae TaxID=70993 RepID=UPI00037C4951|nr:glycosyltransferase family 9 protein [Flexithrix dorotheae]
MTLRKILIIQTAFIGDVILATALIEKLNQHLPEAKIDFLLRKGNEGLLHGHPKLNKVLIWNKKEGKIKNLFKTLNKIRASNYDLVVNIQRFTSSGIFTAFSQATQTIGFHKNPLSFLFTDKIKHDFQEGIHEIDRNLSLISGITDTKRALPKLYPSREDYQQIKNLQTEPYICLAPNSVWFTKQYPMEKWIEFIQKFQYQGKLYLLGAPGDKSNCEEIIAKSGKENIENLAGKLSLLQSAALMESAEMNYVNDSAPMHLASAMNAKTCAIFCSTVPAFGYGPLSEKSTIIQVDEMLNCRPCGLHGHRQCPKGHFKCGKDIKTEKLIEVYANFNN